MDYIDALGLCKRGKYAAADELILEALNKQVPKKPIVDFDNFKGLADYYCPVCHKVIADFIGRNYVKLPTCYCGQKIDWSEVE